jgi:hypothetical protein
MVGRAHGHRRGDHGCGQRGDRWDTRSGRGPARHRGLYVFKIITLAVAVKLLGDASFFNGKLFGFTALICILAYCASQVISSIRFKALYVNPDGER